METLTGLRTLYKAVGRMLETERGSKAAADAMAEVIAAYDAVAKDGGIVFPASEYNGYDPVADGFAYPLVTDEHTVSFADPALD